MDELERKAKELRGRYGQIRDEIEDIAKRLGVKQDEALRTLDELMQCEERLIDEVLGR